MAVRTPENVKQVDEALKADVRSTLRTSNPFLRVSFLGSLLTALANRIFDFFLEFKRAESEGFPDTAIENLNRWASPFGISALPATQAIGIVTIPSTLLQTIPASIGMSTSDGIEFLTAQETSIISETIVIGSAGVTGGTEMFVFTSVEHLLAPGMQIEITGWNEAEFNGFFEVGTVPDSVSIGITLPQSTPNQPTGTSPEISVTRGVVSVTAKKSGKEGNLPPFTSLAFDVPIDGIEEGFAVYPGFSGGLDAETEDGVRKRLLQRLRNPIANFSVGAIEKRLFEIPDVTRVKVFRANPAPGAVLILFMTDKNPVDPFPSAEQINIARDALQDLIPAPTLDSDVQINAATRLQANIIVTGVLPSNQTMFDSVKKELKNLQNNLGIGEPVTVGRLQNVIAQTVDSSTGERIIDFTLVAPTGNVHASGDEVIIFDVAVS